MKNVIQDLIQARKRKGVTQLRLGELSGLPQSHISKIEKGKIDLRLSTLIELARILDCEVVLIPNHLESYVKSLIKNQEFDFDAPRFRPDLDEGENE